MLTDMVRAASDGPPWDPAATPEEVVLTADRASVRLVWGSGVQAEILAGPLRAGCRCAWCTRAHIDGSFPESFGRITIERIAPIGDYALNIAFSDGHARGIYPWIYLRKLALTPDTAIAPREIESAELFDGKFA